MFNSLQKFASILFCLLVVTATAGTAVAIPAPHSASSTSTETAPDSSFGERQVARTILTDATLSGNGQRKERLLTKVEETTGAYLDKNRVSEAPFEIDREIASKTQGKAPAVGTHLATADRLLAEQALEDARTAHQRLRDDDSVSYDTNAVEADIKRAEQELAAASNSKQKAAASKIRHYEKAWNYAHAALDRMDRATTPTVTIDTRDDPPHSNAITYALNGTVTDVRTHEIDSVTIRFADGTTTTAPVVAGAGPFVTGRFNTTVTLEKPVNNITVSATDANDDWAADPPESSASSSTSKNSNGKSSKGKQSKQGKGNSKNAAHQSASTAESTGSATLLLDADALPDTYERTVTKTDPLLTDSDSAVTADDEAGNRVIDGAEDFENDSVRTYTEYVHGLDPFDADTDDDQLSDRFELDYATLDPAVADTDGDGVDDGADDHDGEGLTNVREQRHATNPTLNDTDNDTLTDKYEVDTTLTNPLQTDSDSARTGADEAGNGVADPAEDFDNDTLETGLEADIGTDPFDVDTDGDLLRDAFEHRYSTIDPTTNDTDGDGTPDTFEDPDNETLVNLDEQRNGTVPTNPDTDNDRLDDAYEIRTAETDPTVADSDSARTNRSEAGNGVTDGLEDFDHESLVTHVEADIGTDPFDADTDGDELTDAFEHRFETVDPLLADTDGDGTPDTLEDPDNETLVNIDEQRNGTVPTNPDTDADNLTDAEEIRDAKTNPLVNDSDSARTNRSEANNRIVDGSEDFDRDGLTAAQEYELGTDPFDPDTDGDGLLDGFEHRYETLDPLSADTDGDGVVDAQEDPDNETLVNIDEQAAGTSPLDADTDNDSLTDAFELRHSLTSPVDVDSNSTGTNVTEANNGVTDAAEDFDRDGLSTAREQALGTDPLVADTDADGLPDAYEVRTTKTDPLAADSDSSRTSVNESGNDIVDGAEDFDDDTVVTAAEAAYDTDPFATDTDGDRLEDGFELRYAGFNATLVDSDGDGVVDAETDTDNDSLTALQEQEHGTTPLSNDTDFDTLSDAAEVQVHDTSPVSPDTDGDGLRDDEELELGTDPRVADTDGDGIADGDETFTTSTSNESLGATVSTTGKGNVAEQVEVAESEERAIEVSTVQEAASSEAVTVTAGKEVRSATLDLAYNESSVSKEEDLAVYRYDRERHTMEKVKSSVDASSDTVSGTVSGSGTYVVLSQTEWESNFESELPEKHSQTSEFGDSSRWDCSGTDPNCEGSGESITVGNDSIDTPSISASPKTSTSDETTVGILCLDSGGSVITCPPSGGDDETETPPPTEEEPDPEPEPEPDPDPDPAPSEPTDPVEPEEVSNSTYAAAFQFPDAEDITLSAALSVRTEDDDAYASVRIIGEHSTETLVSASGSDDEATFNSAEHNLDQFAGERVIIHLVALNESAVSVDRFRLTYDTDGDGLSDSVERGGIQTSMGETVYTNPYRTDSDGDGLSDNYEAGRRSRGPNGPIYDIRSNPTKFDSDGDGLGDYEETFTSRTVVTTTSAADSRSLASLNPEAGPDAVREYTEQDRRWTDPRNADSDGDGLSDTREIALSSDPQAADTDGDGVADGEEVAYWGSDPTMFDYQAPEVTVHQAQFEAPDAGIGADDAKAEYGFFYSVADPSGVDEITFQKGGTVEHRLDFAGGQRLSGRAYFTSNAWDSVFDSVTGATVSIHGADEHGNEKRQIGFERANFYGQLAGAVEYEGYADNYAANGVGIISGMSASFGKIRGSAEAIAHIVSNPVAFIQSFRQIIKLLDKLGMLDQIVEQMVGQFQQQMKQNNPYSAETEKRLYEAFKDGWYGGYVVGFLMTVAIGYGAGQVAKSSTIVKKVGRVVRSTTAGRIALGVQGRIDAAQFRVGTALASGSVKIGKAGIRGAKTIGSAVKFSRASRKLDFDVRDLSNTEQENLRRHLLASEDGVTDLNRMSDDERRDFLSLGARSCSRVFTSGITTMNKGCDPGDDDGFEQLRISDPSTLTKLQQLKSDGPLSENDLQRLSNSLDEGDFTTGDIREFAELLNTPNSDLRDWSPSAPHSDIFAKLKTKNDWDHSQVGSTRSEIVTTTNKILDSPDEVYLDEGQDRWVFVKTVEEGGDDITFFMVVYKGDIRTVFAPTLDGVSGISGHTRKAVLKQVVSDRHVKIFDGNSYLSGVNVGDKATEGN